jgi:hypothetical protein
MLKLGKDPLPRSLNLFVPFVLAVVAFMIVMYTTVNIGQAMWTGFGVAMTLWLVSNVTGWNYLSSAAMVATAFLVAGYFVPSMTLPILGFWALVSLVLAHYGSLQARAKDPAVGYSEWLVFEWLVYQVFLATIFVGMYFPLFHYALLALFVGAFAFFLWWAYKAGKHQKMLDQKKPARKRR